MVLDEKLKYLLALLGDGGAADLPLQTALELLCEDRGWPSPPAPYPAISGLPARKDPMLALRLLLVALRVGDDTLKERSLRLGAALGLANPAEALPLLQASCGSSVAPTRALREYFSSPSFLEHVRDRLQPEPMRVIAELSPSRYRHPDDLQATAELERKTPFEGLARLLSKELSERAFSIRNAGTSVKVGPRQFPDLHKRFSRICERMGISPVPPFYLARGDINAFTGGVEEPFVVLHQGVLSKLGPSEQDFVIGHELGHIKFEHVLYQMMARLLAMQGMLLTPNLVLGRILAQGMQLRILDWSRKAELSCDRAGLLACQSPEAALRVMLRFAGVPESRLDELNIQAYLEQYDVLEDANATRIGRLFSGIYESHPWIIERVKNLREWVDSGEYDALLEQSPLESQAGKEKAQDLGELLGQLAMTGVGERWIDALSGQGEPRSWSLGERERERLKAGDLLASSGQWIGAEGEEQGAILPKDRAVFNLNANALLSITEKEELRRIAAVPGLEWAAAVWGAEDLAEEDRTELEQRAGEFIQPLGGGVYFMDKEGRSLLSAWAQSPHPSDRTVQELISENPACLPALDPSVLEERHREAVKAGLAELERGFSGLEQEFAGWFAPMNIEERRHEGARRLAECCAEILQEASEAYWSFLPNSSLDLPAEKLRLSKRSQEISKPLVAAGIGCLAFGSMLFPAAPLWFSLGGVGVGLASMASGRQLLSRQAEELAEAQLEQVSEWIAQTKRDASASLTRIAGLQLETWQELLGGGWEPILAETAKRREAAAARTG